MGPQKYKVAVFLDDHPALTLGMVVYEYQGHDQGISDEDTATTGEEHIPVTLSGDGFGTFYSMPLSHLEKVG